MAPAGRAVLIAVGAAVTAGLGAAPADADSILFRCFPNLCRVAPDGSARAQITHDAAAGGPVYGWLSATPDGSRLGVSFGNRSYVLDRLGRRLAGPLPHSGGPVLVTQIRPDVAPAAVRSGQEEVRDLGQRRLELPDRLDRRHLPPVAFSSAVTSRSSSWPCWGSITIRMPP